MSTRRSKAATASTKGHGKTLLSQSNAFSHEDKYWILMLTVFVNILDSQGTVHSWQGSGARVQGRAVSTSTIPIRRPVRRDRQHHTHQRDGYACAADKGCQRQQAQGRLRVTQDEPFVQARPQLVRQAQWLPDLQRPLYDPLTPSPILQRLFTVHTTLSTVAHGPTTTETCQGLTPDLRSRLPTSPGHHGV